ncbi:unnamed protein product [Protopolystoma xenopodis]|uniref:Uncharacterized protein n=1 Tax=Protopolystoma xenopodis TaxID=117903 RepID=A0A448X9Y2_9PLAT|nr:unnamed protein product [Protopolystoma xenopodis]
MAKRNASIASSHISAVARVDFSPKLALFHDGCTTFGRLSRLAPGSAAQEKPCRFVRRMRLAVQANEMSPQFLQLDWPRFWTLSRLSGFAANPPSRASIRAASPVKLDSVQPRLSIGDPTSWLAYLLFTSEFEHTRTPAHTLVRLESVWPDREQPRSIGAFKGPPNQQDWKVRIERSRLAAAISPTGLASL